MASKVIMAVALLVFAYAVFQVVTIQLEYRRGNDEYANLENEFIQKGEAVQSGILQRVEELGGSAQASNTTANNSGIEVDFAALRKQNPDVIAWIHFPNADISYPIMQGTDNEYYLKHTFKKESNSNGSIFMDYLNNSNFTDDNTLIFGHNMKSGAMFGTLKHYKDASYYEENPCFYILRPDKGAERYDIFSLYETDSLDTYTTAFASEKAKADFIESIRNKSLHSIEMDIDATDNIVTLVTCPQARATRDTRFIVHAKAAGK